MKLQTQGCVLCGTACIASHPCTCRASSCSSLVAVRDCNVEACEPIVSAQTPGSYTDSLVRPCQASWHCGPGSASPDSLARTLCSLSPDCRHKRGLVPVGVRRGCSPRQHSPPRTGIDCLQPTPNHSGKLLRCAIDP